MAERAVLSDEPMTSGGSAADDETGAVDFGPISAVSDSEVMSCIRCPNNKRRHLHRQQNIQQRLEYLPVPVGSPVAFGVGDLERSRLGPLVSGTA